MAFDPTGVISAHDFDGNGNDASGNGNHLPDASGTAPTYDTGAQGTQINLLASTWIGKTGSSTPWQIGLADFSAAFWIFPANNNLVEALASTGAFSTTEEGYALQVRTTTAGGGQSRPFISDGSTRDANALANIGLDFGAANHVVFNIDVDGNIETFVDGVSEGTVAYGFNGTDIGSQNDFFHIGGDGTFGFIGAMAQAIFKRGLFSQDDIDAMFNGGTRLTYEELLPAGSGSSDIGSGSGEFGSGSGEVPGSGSGVIGSGSGEAGSGSGVIGSGSGEAGSGSGVIGSGSGEVPGSGSGEPEPCESLIFNVAQAVKLETLKTYIEGILANHTNGGVWRVNELVTKHLLGLESRYDFENVFGDPVRWCRIAPVDQPSAVDNVDDIRDVHNSSVLVTHEYEIIIQYQFQEDEAFTGSTTQEWYNLLWGECPDGILTAFNTVGALEVDDGSGEIIQINKPESIALPSMPLVAFGSNLAGDGEQLLIHHVDFRVQLT